MTNLQITIQGQVYKVGLRYFIKQMAKHYGIIGSVKYIDDHTINVEATGVKDKMDQFIFFCKLGCPGSDVKSIRIKEKKSTIQNSFEIIE